MHIPRSLLRVHHPYRLHTLQQVYIIATAVRYREQSSTATLQYDVQFATTTQYYAQHWHSTGARSSRFASGHHSKCSSGLNPDLARDYRNPTARCTPPRILRETKTRFHCGKRWEYKEPWKRKPYSRHTKESFSSFEPTEKRTAPSTSKPPRRGASGDQAYGTLGCS